MLGWLLIVAGLAGALALLLAGQQLAARIPVESLAGQIVVFYLALFAPLALLSLALGAVERRPVLRAGDRPLGSGMLGLAAGVAGLLACVLLVWLQGSLRPGVPEAGPGWTFLALGLGVTVLQVGAEELLFRGWLLPALADRTATWLAVALSALAFAGFHLVGGAAHPLSLLNLTLGGVWFALLAVRTGGLLAPFAAHFGWNIAEDLGFGLIPNPGRGEFGALSDKDIVGPVLWGGGEEGLNASLAMTLVLIALILPLLPRRAQGSASQVANVASGEALRR